MTKNEAIVAVVGKRIVSVRLHLPPGLELLRTDDKTTDGNWTLDAFVLDDGTVLEFRGASQIDTNDVWFEVTLPAPPEKQP